MEKIDTKKTRRDLCDVSPTDFAIIDVPPLDYLMIDGRGDPNVAADYKDAVTALYSAAYTLKFASKAALGRDFVVPPLEGLWWSDDYDDFLCRRKELWSWTMMISMPAFIETDMAAAAIARALKTKGLPALEKVRFASLDEGRVVQILHIGAYDDETPVLKTLHDAFMPANGLVATGRHHEIYLSDPRKVAAEKLKTILRQPVGPAT